MLSVNDLYVSVFSKLNDIDIRYKEADEKLAAATKRDEIAIAKRIENLNDQLEKIKKYRESVENFKNIAEKNITSKNLLTIIPRELNFNRMRNWARCIDISNDDDPYAQRVYVQAMCNLMFLDQKEAEFKEIKHKLENPDNSVELKIEAEVRMIKRQLENETKAVLNSSTIIELRDQIINKHNSFNDTKILQTISIDGISDSGVGLGYYNVDLPVVEPLRNTAKELFGTYYDADNSTLAIPLEVPSEKDVIISVTAASSELKKLYRGIQYFLLSALNKAPANSRRIHFIDALHYNNSAINYLRALEQKGVIEPVPRDSEQILDELKLIVSSFTDIDETIGVYDSIKDYNDGLTDKKDRIERKILVLVGYPTAYSGDAKELIQRILYNNKRYGITPILIDTHYSEKKDEEKTGIPEDIIVDISVKMSPSGTSFSNAGSAARFFKWYELRSEISNDFVELAASLRKDDSKIGTVYTKRYSLQMPEYQRGNKTISLPYGVDAKDQVFDLTFSNENFAMFLMGASGSGKSTLLHTLITGILRQYHPDDVELWLADFKMSEFAQYINPMPPHVKYILLDESKELVFDLIDRLTEVMMYRQRFFMKNRNLKKVEQVPNSFLEKRKENMPIIFVILDEFSIMSQAVNEDERYKLKLQNLLAKGRALGIKFIFASQTFTKGVAGLSSTAKEQIQTRIAMKNSRDEISDTLELSSSLKTERVKSWMDALPPHYVLAKYREEDSWVVKRLQVMYFEGKEDVYKPQRELIESLIQNMKPTSEYDPGNINNYVDKHPVVIDGNSYSPYDGMALTEEIMNYRDKHPNEVADEDKIITFGTPRKMSKYAFSTITNESRENILLIADSTELPCAMSIIKTVSNLFSSQFGQIEVRAYPKNRLFRTFGDVQFRGITVRKGTDEICQAISEYNEKISKKESMDRLVILLGMEQIYGDFSLLSAKPEQIAEQIEVGEGNPDVKEFYSLNPGLQEAEDELLEKLLEEGKSEAEIQKALEKLYENTVRPETITATENSSDLSNDRQEYSAEYDASADFIQLIKLGSRQGLHFLLYVNGYPDIKATGLTTDFFKHKMAFQISKDDSSYVFGSGLKASKLPEHICFYSDSLDEYSFRPFTHEGIEWELQDDLDE